MRRAAVTVSLSLFGLLSFAPVVLAQCVTIEARICQGGWIYVCEPCGSEKCWIATSERCAKDDPRNDIDLKYLHGAGQGEKGPAGHLPDNSSPRVVHFDRKEDLGQHP